jgi:hypothetical protein
MEKLDKIVEIATPEMKVEVDPRSKSTADKAYNGIAVPEEVEVRGTKRMLKEKSKKAKWI